MKFTKFGKALLMSALSAGVVLSVTSCVQSYSVGFLFVTGTVTSQTGGSGIISGFKIDHNTGKLTSINGLPVSSGGANPVRAVLLTGGRFLYVLNRGVNCIGQVRLHDRGSVPELEHHAVRGWRERHSDPAGDLLHAGHQSLPIGGRLARELHLCAGPRFAEQLQPVSRADGWRDGTGADHDLRRHYGILGQPDDRPAEPGD